MRTLCKYCGTLGARNITRQWEHLQQCEAFLNSPESENITARGLSAKGDGGWLGRGTKSRTAQVATLNSEFARPPNGVSTTANGTESLTKPPKPGEWSTLVSAKRV